MARDINGDRDINDEESRIIRDDDVRDLPTPRTRIPRAPTVMKVYSPFGEDDIVDNLSRRVTTGMWTGDTGSLETFFTLPVQSASSGDWYYDICNLTASDASTEVQFAIAYGHKNGGGAPSIAYSNTSKEPTKAIYSQYRNTLLDPEDETFTFAGGKDSDHIFVINLQRARLKQKMDAGNWELHLSSGSEDDSNFISLKLIDDSGDKFDQNVSQGGRIFNVVSGTLNIGSSATIYKQASSEPSGGYGLFYPDRGLIVLNPNALQHGFGLDVGSGSLYGVSTSSLTLANNHGELFANMKHPSASSFTARNEEIVTSTHYFVRVKNKDYNLSNNPSYYTSSDGTLKVPAFIGDPHTYLTTVGLYDDGNVLLAVAKVSVPLLKSFDREALIKVKLDY
jgi:hypothetical protein